MRNCLLSTRWSRDVMKIGSFCVCLRNCRFNGLFFARVCKYLMLRFSGRTKLKPLNAGVDFWLDKFNLSLLIFWCKFKELSIAQCHAVRRMLNWLHTLSQQVKKPLNPQLRNDRHFKSFPTALHSSISDTNLRLNLLPHCCFSFRL